MNAKAQKFKSWIFKIIVFYSANGRFDLIWIFSACQTLKTTFFPNFLASLQNYYTSGTK